MTDITQLSRRRFVQGTGTAAPVGTAGVQPAATAADEGSAPAGGGLDAPSVVAHRGFAGVYPETTVGAELASIQDGADALDIDIMPCADGTVLGFHDRRLDRLTDLEGLVATADSEAVTSAEVLDSGETVATLRQLLRAIPSEVPVQLEFKNPGTVDLLPNRVLDEAKLARQMEKWRPFTDRVLDILAEFDHDVLVAASREAALATVRERDPTIPLAFYFSDSIEVGLEITRRYDCEVLYPPINMIDRTPLFNSPDYYVEEPDFADVDLVEVAHEEGRELYVFTVETWYEADQLRTAGVDGILSNYPNVYESDVTPPREALVEAGAD
jgi:glycerophosphoryl diester phosphodiesterase